MADEILSYEVFRSARGAFIALPQESGALDADLVVFDQQKRLLSLEKDGSPMSIRLAKLPAEGAPALQGLAEIVLAEFVLGGVTGAAIKPIRLSV